MTSLEPPDHGIYRCVTGATIPKDQRTAGQPCPFCGRTLSLTPTIQDKTSKRPSQALVIVLAVVVGFTVVPVLLIAAALFLGTEIDERFSEVGNTLQSTADTPGTPTFLVDLESGDCWRSEDYAAAAFGEVVELVAVEVVPCGQGHIGELFTIAALPGGPSADYPGDLQVLYQAQRICTEQFEATFDSSYESSTLDIFHLFPTAESWRLGDRDVSCSVTTVYLDPINGPAAAINDQLPGSDLGILAASSCEAITDAMVINAQLTIDVLGSLTPERWALLETSGAVPEFERVLKRDSLMALRAHEIGCTLTELNVVFLARIDELEANTFDGQAMLTSFNDAGYWDESPLP